MTFAERLEELRLQQDLSVPKLADALGLPHGTVRAWLYGRRSNGPKNWPRPDQAQKVADFFFSQSPRHRRLALLYEGVEGDRAA